MKKAPFSIQKEITEGQDLGFGRSMSSSASRMLNTDGSFNIRRSGYKVNSWYQTLIDLNWSKFLGVTFLFMLWSIFYLELYIICFLQTIS
ncbi:MAG: hypothetical protein IPP01_05670 [Saprospiraceae bacterium]|nr:hypothetical protein [Saprospiraceae bacterium]